MAITISKHAKERYAERIMDRDCKTDVLMFIRDHEDKIQQDIEKMLEYGTLLYEGPSSRDPKKAVGVTINGSWVIIWDTREFTVITLYCIDLGVGDEANKIFIERALAQIEAAKREQEATKQRTAESIAVYQGIIEAGETKLRDYRKRVKDVEAQIAGCRSMIQSITADDDIADDNVREKVEILIGKQRF